MVEVGFSRFSCVKWGECCIGSCECKIVEKKCWFGEWPEVDEAKWQGMCL